MTAETLVFRVSASRSARFAISASIVTVSLFFMSSLYYLSAGITDIRTELILKYEKPPRKPT